MTEAGNSIICCYCRLQRHKYEQQPLPAQCSTPRAELRSGAEEKWSPAQLEHRPLPSEVVHPVTVTVLHPRKVIEPWPLQLRRSMRGYARTRRWTTSAPPVRCLPSTFTGYEVMRSHPASSYSLSTATNNVNTDFWGPASNFGATPFPPTHAL